MKVGTHCQTTFYPSFFYLLFLSGGGEGGGGGSYQHLVLLEHFLYVVFSE